MLIERTTKEVIIRLPASIDTEDLQDFLNYARYKEITSKFKVPQSEVEKITAQVKKNWLAKKKASNKK
jgi:hypothetical protein